MIKKLQVLVQDVSAKSGVALVARKNWAPINCLSCGRGDANFAPMVPHVQGVDGRLYKADGALAKGPVLAVNELEYDIGLDVFPLDSH